MTRGGCAACVLMVVPACFHPSYDHPECGPHDECSSGRTCGLEGSCFSLDECAPVGSQFGSCLLGIDDDLMLSGAITYDTTIHELKLNGAMMPIVRVTLLAKAGNVDAIVAHNVRLTAGVQLRATRMLTFAIVASGSVTLEDGATIDVSDGGAGAQTSCANPPMPGSDNTGGAGGGGGGGYGAEGGQRRRRQ